MKIRMSAEGFDLSRELEKYTSAKVAHLEKAVPRKFKVEATCEVHFAQTHKKDVKFNTCSITVILDDTQLKAAETTQHMYSALDIAAVHIESQLDAFAAQQKKHPVRTRLKRRFHPGE
jgi:ribosomal subunit interface protein